MGKKYDLLEEIILFYEILSPFKKWRDNQTYNPNNSCIWLAEIKPPIHMANSDCSTNQMLPLTSHDSFEIPNTINSSLKIR